MVIVVKADRSHTHTDGDFVKADRSHTHTHTDGDCC